ncbi:MAG: PilW family protein [Undibacterium sp.]|nr:PilW family protein [Undibacterium sp.]
MTTHRKHRQAGRTLVELMIALTIGLVIMLAVTALFITNNASSRVSDDKTRLDEEGYLALNLIAFHIRMAGYGSLKKITPTGATEADQTLQEAKMYTNFTGNSHGVNTNAIRGCANGFSNPAASAETVNCNSGTGSNAVLVRYVVDALSSNVSSGTGLPVDCLGAEITVNPAIDDDPAYFVADNRFFVQTNPETQVPELYCLGNGGTSIGATALANPAQPVAENVEKLIINYGLSDNVDKKANSQVVARFLPAEEMLTTGESSLVNAEWNRVISARICIVVRSANNNITLRPQTYFGCDGKSVTANDRRLRGVFSTTVTIRNRTGVI